MDEKKEETNSAELNGVTEELSEDSEEELSAENDLTESEPYLGPAWAIVVLILYAIKTTFPAEDYSLYWWFQHYIIGIVIAVAIFTLIKRHRFYHSD